MLLEKFLPRHDPDFLSHLEELRGRLLVSLLVFISVSTVSYFYSQQILDFLTQPLARYGSAELYFQKPYEAFLTHIKVAAFAGFVFSLPVLFTQLWMFMAPGLYRHEKKVLFLITFASALLFLLGAAFAYSVIIPWGLHFLLSFQSENLKPILGISPYFSFVSGMLLAFGLLFDFPVLVMGLIHTGVTDRATLAHSRRAVIIAIFILAAILTPSPDPISQLALAIPLLALFEISLLLGRFLEHRKDL